VWRNGSATDL